MPMPSCWWIRRAGTLRRAHLPTNISILLLPPKSSELNAAEDIWQFMRDNGLSNRVLKSVDDILDHCCDVWNNLVARPRRIMSIAIRD